jgi:hypothetical protein
MAEHERANDRHALAQHFELRARDYEHDVKIMKELLRSGEVGSAGGGTSRRKQRTIAVHERRHRQAR